MMDRFRIGDPIDRGQASSNRLAYGDQAEPAGCLLAYLFFQMPLVLAKGGAGNLRAP
jgi:hypothetical protein